MSMKRTIFLGWDHREQDAFKVAKASLIAHSPAVASGEIEVRSIQLALMRASGLYWRQHDQRGGVTWDRISDAPISTDFAVSRFLTPSLAGDGAALFCDCDVLFRRDVAELFALFDPTKAVQVVKHQMPEADGIKMDGQKQIPYPRKNWSSVCLYAADHPANRALDIEMVNTATGRDLHGFHWLADDQIGELPATFNHLVGVDPHDPDCAIAHLTLGIPTMPGYENSPFSQEWRSYL